MPNDESHIMNRLGADLQACRLTPGDGSNEAYPTGPIREGKLAYWHLPSFFCLFTRRAALLFTLLAIGPSTGSHDSDWPQGDSGSFKVPIRSRGATQVHGHGPFRRVRITRNQRLWWGRRLDFQRAGHPELRWPFFAPCIEEEVGCGVADLLGFKTGQ